MSSMGETISVSFPSSAQFEDDKHKEIKIEIIDDCYLVLVGCSKFIFKDSKSLSTALELYRKDPKAAREKYVK